MIPKLLPKYAHLLVNTGIRPEKGQKVVINASVEQAPLVRLLTEECYKVGARTVRVEWMDQGLTKIQYQYQSEDDLANLDPWRVEKLKQDADDLVCRLFIDDEDPDALKDIDAKKMMAVRQRQYPIIKPFRDQIENRDQWLIAGAASPAWANKVFPDLETDKAVERLWQAIFDACHLTEDNDAVAAWDMHNKTLTEKFQKLNDYQFTSLHYESQNGTDFTCGLIDGARWLGGGEDSDEGRFFNPNMPSEEVFTTPKRGEAKGKVVATKPLSYQGQLIDEFWIEFEEGKAVRWDAKVGKDSLDSMLNADEGARYIGELALVPVDSPISRSGILFYNTLFDENASCHIAMGRGFSNLLPDYQSKTEDELLDMGCNVSMIHTDFMIGQEDMNITGTRADGSKVVIFKDGNWAI